VFRSLEIFKKTKKTRIRCVLCACAVRVGVCGGSVCLGALRYRKKKKKKKKNEYIFILAHFYEYEYM